MSEEMKGTSIFTGTQIQKQTKRKIGHFTLTFTVYVKDSVK